MSQLATLNEDLARNRISEKAELYERKYAAHMRALNESSLIRKVRPIQEFDIYALGAQLEQFEDYCAVNEADGSINDLGRVPEIGIDVLTLSYGTSILPIVASIQPMDEEKGIVYYKTVKAGMTKGNLVKDSTIVNTYAGYSNIPESYASSEVSTTIAAVVPGTQAYSTALSSVPIRPGTLTVFLASDPANKVHDYGNNGVVATKDYYVEVNYETGLVNITFHNNPVAPDNLVMNYHLNLETVDELPSIISTFESTTITAHEYALRTPLGLFKNFAMRKRFGSMLDDEATADLANEINAELSGNLIRKMKNAAKGLVQWNQNPGAGVSMYEHLLSLRLALADSEAQIAQNAGRGVITGIIAGTNVASKLSTLNGWNQIYDGQSISGAHVFGSLDGKVVIRVPDNKILNPNEAYCYYKGPSVFEAPAVYAPFMPLMVSRDIPNGTNPLMTNKVAAIMAGIEVLTPNFVTKFEIVNEPQTVNVHHD